MTNFSTKSVHHCMYNCFQFNTIVRRLCRLKTSSQNRTALYKFQSGLVSIYEPCPLPTLVSVSSNPDSNLRLVLTNKTWFPYRTFSPARWWRCLFGSAAVGSWRAVGDRTFAWRRCAPFALTPPSPGWGGVWCLFVRRLVLRLRIFVRTAVLGRKFRTEKDKKAWLTNCFGHLF